MIGMACPELDDESEVLETHIMEASPAVMSLGARCQLHGYDFIWLGSRGWPPYFITPSGKIIIMEVIGRIPYIRTGSDDCQPQLATSSISIPAPPAYACPAPSSSTSPMPEVGLTDIPVPDLGNHQMNLNERGEGPGGDATAGTEAKTDNAEEDEFADAILEVVDAVGGDSAGVGAGGDAVAGAQPVAPE